MVYRHFPLFPGGIPLQAAIAAECAGRQDRFKAYHDLLYRNQDGLETRPWLSLADEAGVPDRDAFEICLDDPTIAHDIIVDRESSQRIGVSSTPTLVINGHVVRGAVPVGIIKDRVKEVLNEVPIARPN